MRPHRLFDLRRTVHRHVPITFLNTRTRSNVFHTTSDGPRLGLAIQIVGKTSHLQKILEYFQQDSLLNHKKQIGT